MHPDHSTEPQATKELKIGEFVIIGDHCYRVGIDAMRAAPYAVCLICEGDALYADALADNFREKTRILQERAESWLRPKSDSID